MVIRLRFLSKTNIIGITLFPFIFVRPDANDITLNHERIHIQQQLELGVILFYILYLWWSIKYGYWNNPFEIEAYYNEQNVKYLTNRKRWNYFR